MERIVMAMVGMVATVASAEAIRFEAPDAARPVVATGVELRGELDGSAVTEWNTLLHEDGWLQLVSGEECVDVLVLNTPQVEGGRLSANTAWGADRVHVVRDDVVVPSGVTLSLAAGCVVKFLPNARIVTEDGGNVLASGALLADFADDSVGGDVNMDAATTLPSGVEWWIEDGAVASLATVVFRDGGEEVSPKRSYTAGSVYGELPERERDDARFEGWFTESGDGGVRITSASFVGEGRTTLYAHWTAYSLEIGSDHAEVEAVGGRQSFDVSATGEWTAASDADWIAVETDGDEGDGTVWFTVLANATSAKRSGTIRVTLANGVSRDFTVTQDGMAAIAQPVINPADGTTFSGSSRRASISCATEGAEIRYTLDGSEPTESSKLYAKSFNVFDTTTVKAKAFKTGMLASPTAVARIVRLPTLAEAMNVPLWTVTTDNAAPWTVVADESKDGVSAVRSGVIGCEEETSLTTTVDGYGTLTFWWKTSCEDDPDYDNWDYLAVSVDQVEIARIDGETPWREVAIQIKGDGAHTVTWTYHKDYMDDIFDIEDCGWVDQVSWASTVGESSVPSSWLEGLGLAKAGESASAVASQDPDGDGFTNEEEYIIGTDPTDPNSTFKASIEMVDGKPVITYEPDLLGERKYTKWGRKDLADPTEAWQKVDEGKEADYNFFKITVEKE